MSVPAGPRRPPPTPEQLRAADPARSVWVTASAGTGKTRVLADRVLRLLLRGADPERVLCLTFTKAGAAEMVTRIQDDLARFAGLNAAALRQELRVLLGRPAEQREVDLARALLVRILDLPAGLPVMTIHSFCQSLLRRFALEAGVPPHFEVLEPRDADELMAAGLDAVLEDPAADLDRALETLAVLVGERGFQEGLDALRQDRLRFERGLERAGGRDGMVRAVADRLGVDPDATRKQLCREACAASFDSPGLAAACRALAGGGKHDQMAGPIIETWVRADLEERLKTLEAYKGVFLNKEGDPHGHFLTKTVRASAPAAVAALESEQRRLAEFVQRLQAVEVFERSRALIEVGAAALGEYARRKRARAGLDYDDLIERSNHLLERAGVAPWIQYKLDQRIDHLLVDEGQDTSPGQWAVIEALTTDFFAGEGAAEALRTMFVVGDEKQSIFSFQGADLATFSAVRARLARRAGDARRRLQVSSLNKSFRSVDAVLEVVDLVFQDPEAAAGLGSHGAVPAHVTGRPGLPGTVELWPLVEVERPAQPASWELPDRPDPVVSAERTLAEAIAERIGGWLERETPLSSTDQPIRPGDIMILLRARSLVRDLLIRELKRRHVPVAGADRLRLTDEIAVTDLIALGDSLLLPEDDLTLACVLKSPLFGFDEERLFQLAHGRERGFLFHRLREAAGADPMARAALERFERLRARVDRMPPFEFYARLLGEGDRQRLLERLGPAAAEPVEALLAQALAYERAHPPSLQGFLHWLRQDTTELVRDPDQPRDEVRVLTVHGAKGLEAPIVILADAAFPPTDLDRLLWLEDGIPLWRVGKDRRDPVSQATFEAARKAQIDEERRLLYVAMTRARDWLIVAGWNRKSRSKDTATWHDLIQAGLELHPEVERTGARSERDPAGGGLRLCRTRRQAGLPLTEPVKPKPVPPPLPERLARPAPEEVMLRSPLSPSRLADAEPPADPPEGAGDTRFRIGLAVHRLLQILPDLPPAARRGAADRLLEAPDLELDGPRRHELRREVLALLEAPELGSLFGAGSRAEVPVIGAIGGVPISGQIDRLVIEPERILLVDYKTNRTPPAMGDPAPLAYRRQLAAYRHLLEDAFPGRPVRCGLLWTVGPRLDLLDDAALDDALGGLAGG